MIRSADRHFVVMTAGCRVAAIDPRAQDFHDTLGHSLTVISMQLEAALAIMPADPLRGREAVHRAQSVTRDALLAVRQSIQLFRCPKRAPDHEAMREGLGLRGIRERGEALGGRFAAGNRPGGGFRHDLEVPDA